MLNKKPISFETSFDTKGGRRTITIPALTQNAAIDAVRNRFPYASCIVAKAKG